MCSMVQNACGTEVQCGGSGDDGDLEKCRLLQVYSHFGLPSVLDRVPQRGKYKVLELDMTGLPLDIGSSFVSSFLKEELDSRQKLVV